MIDQTRPPFFQGGQRFLGPPAHPPDAFDGGPGFGGPPVHPADGHPADGMPHPQGMKHPDMGWKQRQHHSHLAMLGQNAQPAVEPVNPIMAAITQMLGSYQAASPFGGYHTN